MCRAAKRAALPVNRKGLMLSLVTTAGACSPCERVVCAQPLLRSLVLVSLLVGCAPTPPPRADSTGSGAPTAVSTTVSPRASATAARTEPEASALASARLSAPAPALSMDECLGLLDVSRDASARDCDSGFVPRHGPFAHCRPSDLVCIIRSGGWHHAPVYSAATTEQLSACAAECDRGNGASCQRVAKALDDGIAPVPADRSQCAQLFSARACSLALPLACELQDREGDSARAAFERLREACTRGEASWDCFYTAHSIEMLWGAGLGDSKPLYRKICGGRCPAPPKRCYKSMACAILRL